MKKYLFLIYISILVCYNGHAQSLRGISLGDNRMMGVLNLPDKFSKNTHQTDNYLQYVNPNEPNEYLAIYLKDDRICKISINDVIYIGSDVNYAKRRLEERLIELYEDWGEPSYIGENVYWTFPYAKAEFSYNIITRKVDDIANYDPFYHSYIPKYTQYKCQVRVELEFTADSFDVINNTKQSNSEYQSSGSGFILSSNGIIVTNYHVVEDANGIDVLINQKGEVKTYKAEVLISDKTNDISLLKIKDNSFIKFAALPYAVNTRILDVGTKVFALGYPMSNILGEEIKLTDGLISSKTGYQGDIVTYQISAPIQPGNSGGPLFDQNGNIVGITNAGVPDAQNVGYAIKTSYLRNLVDVAPETITLPTQNSISGLSFTEKIKKLTPYVVLIIVY